MIDAMLRTNRQQVGGQRTAGRPAQRGAWLLLVPLGLGLGCAEPQRPYQFTARIMARDPLEALASAFAQAGQPPVIVDPQTGTVSGRWIDTKILDGQIAGRDATVVRRYSATLVHGAFGNEVTLSGSSQRCARLDFTLTEIDVRGSCLPMERLLPQHQQELISLGQRLQQSMTIP
jgi:hypothetical protein